jgi:GDP-4-dehydro-6-deoxy-D-mannose reductase
LSRRILVTGASGFVASHLADVARAGGLGPGDALVGLVRQTSGARSLPDGFSASVEADLLDASGLRAAVAEARATHALHMAGQSSVHESYRDPGGTLLANVLGTHHLLAACEAAAVKRILIVGSAEEYGVVDRDAGPLREDRPLAPASPYAISRVAQSALCAEFAKRGTLDVIRTRTFPHTGPRRGAVFAESSFARQIAEIEAGRRAPVIDVGNIDAVRDFSDVRDVVRAYALLLDRGENGAVYNVCSGRGVRIGAVLDLLVSWSRVRVEVRVDPSRLRPVDVPALIGDPSRLRAATGFAPSGDIEGALRGLLDHWRGVIAREQASE